MFQMFQYFIKGIALKNNMYLGNDNDITFFIYLFTEITLWYTMHVRHDFLDLWSRAIVMGVWGHAPPRNFF